MTEVKDLVAGVLSQCYCGSPAVQWIEHEGQYVCVHERCLAGLPAVLEELAELRSVVAAPASPRGAYARRTARAPRVVVSRLTVAPLGMGSPFHVPGMVEGAPWTVLVQTNLGQMSLPCNRNEPAARRGNQRYRAMWERGLEAAYGGVRAVGGMIVTPAGSVDDAWGDAPVIGSSRWRPVHRTGDWRSCTSCGRQLWPGCFVGVQSGCCAVCMASDEKDDPRVWPDEPPYPGDDAWPGHSKKSGKKS